MSETQVRPICPKDLHEKDYSLPLRGQCSIAAAVVSNKTIGKPVKAGTLESARIGKGLGTRKSFLDARFGIS